MVVNVKQFFLVSERGKCSASGFGKISWFSFICGNQKHFAICGICAKCNLCVRVKDFETGLSSHNS